jgi:type IV pilus assembly protein PilB
MTPVELLLNLSRQAGVELVDLDAEVVDAQAARIIPGSLARRHRALPIGWDGDTLVVAMSDPADLFALDDIRAVTRTPVRAVMCETRQLHDAIGRWAQNDNDADTVQAPSPTVKTRGAADAVKPSSSHIRFVDLVLARAVAERASDVHLEPVGDGLRVRFRVDGVLRDALTAPTGTEAGVVSRLKIIAGMDIAERRLPQDGRCSHEIDGATVDLRVATVPTINGEAAVVRILDGRSDITSLDDLGLLPANRARFEAAIARPWGAVLVSGPTGSGKTTTLYAALGQLNTPERNIITVEDPVEITMDGVKQVQVNARAGLTFASALRSFLRADPDVVLIGEIRDKETATIATEASLTGHLVLSTIHTNDAASTPMRLLEMGVEPFLVGSALSAVVAQRLTRRLCERCRQPVSLDADELVAIGWTAQLAAERAAPPAFHRSVGCPACGGTGYRGRLAIHEVLVIDEELSSLVSRRAGAVEMRAAAAAQGMHTLRADGLAKAAASSTSIDEVLRVLV